MKGDPVDEELIVFRIIQYLAHEEFCSGIDGIGVLNGQRFDVALQLVGDDGRMQQALVAEIHVLPEIDAVQIQLKGGVESAVRFENFSDIGVLAFLYWV